MLRSSLVALALVLLARPVQAETLEALKLAHDQRVAAFAGLSGDGIMNIEHAELAKMQASVDTIIQKFIDTEKRFSKAALISIRRCDVFQPASEPEIICFLAATESDRSDTVQMHWTPATGTATAVCAIDGQSRDITCLQWVRDLIATLLIEETLVELRQRQDLDGETQTKLTVERWTAYETAYQSAVDAARLSKQEINVNLGSWSGLAVDLWVIPGARSFTVNVTVRQS